MALTSEQIRQLDVLESSLPDYHRLVDLAPVGQQIDQALGMLIDENVDTRNMLNIMSRLHGRMIRQVIRIAEDNLAQNGCGRPPVNYCWINMGSAARREQTLRTDQDNALIYADSPPGQEKAVDAYFEELAAHVVAGLDRCGFQLCKGNVMATNPQWRRSLGRWRAAMADWTRSVDPQDARILTILLDFQPVWGDFNLAEQFRSHVFSMFGDSLNAGHMLTRDDRHHSSAVGFLGSIVTEKSGPHKNQLNLKTTAIVHIVNGLRLLALHSRIAAASSLDRIDHLAAAGVLSAAEVDLFRDGFETLMMFRIRENYQKFITGLTPDNYIDPRRLSTHEHTRLKDALAAVTQLQKLIHRRFNVAWMRFFS